jgi:hypothetical protein
MNKTIPVESGLFFMFLALCAALLLVPAVAGAQANCGAADLEVCVNTAPGDADTDGDGFSDYLECFGTNDPTGAGKFWVGAPEGGTSQVFLLGFNAWAENGSTAPRKEYVNPCEKDLFVAFAPDNPDMSKITEETKVALEAIAMSDLSVALHFIDPANYFGDQYNLQTIRQVTGASPQKGVTIRENVTDANGADGTILGLTYPMAGVNPNVSTLSVTVFSQRVESFVADRVCTYPDYRTCKDVNSGLSFTRQGPEDLESMVPFVALYNYQNALHELAHSTALADTYDAHYPVDTRKAYNNTMMSQYVYYKPYKKSQSVDWYFPRSFDPVDRLGVHLK